MADRVGRLTLQAAALAAAAGLAGPYALDLVPGGRNNRTFVLHTADGRAFLKAYFKHPGDPRDRLGAETALLAHASALGVTNVPKLLAMDVRAGLALFCFVEGRRLGPGEIAWPQVEAAADLYLGLNQRPVVLAEASEACFSLAAHLDCIDRRVERLNRAAAAGLLRPVGARFVRDDLGPAWRSLRGNILDAAPRLLGASWNIPLPAAHRRVSPSDFGFHNALLTPEGGLVFCDFEYAGMDDPAKMVCDFFCQPEVPVPLDLLPRFLERTAEASAADTSLPARAELLLPAYGVKWCCIMLNDFLPEGAARRRFAAGDDDQGRQDRQLALARNTLLECIDTTRWPK
jgi:hypothetical protein